MGSGVARVMVGSYVGTGSAINIDVVGFRPKAVQILGAGALIAAWWTKTMADATVHKIINHDSVQNSLATSNGITPRSNGFQVGTDADLNTATEVSHWIAWE